MIYNIVLNSNNNVGGTNSSNCEYYFNWSILEEGEYELTTCFNAEGSTVHKLILITCPDLGVCTNVFTTGTLQSANYKNILGALLPSGVSTSLVDIHYGANVITNPPIYLRTRPSSNKFTILLTDVDGSLVNILTDYVLFLSFKKI